MRNYPARPWIVAASLWIGFFAVGPCHGAGVILTTPPGLKPGEQFQFIFLTNGTTDATSTDIDTYNNFVNKQAQGATYDGQTVTWYAIASTPTVSRSPILMSTVSRST